MKSSPVALFNISDEEQFQFNHEECYLVFLIYLNGTECKFISISIKYRFSMNSFILEPNDLQNFPQSLIEVAKSTVNLSPRGLKNIFQSNVEQLE